MELVREKAGKQKLEINLKDQTIALMNESGETGTPHAVKPLAQLYGSGTGSESVEFEDNAFLSLLLSIEESILDAFKDQPSLTDAGVLFALDRLCMTPDANMQSDPLAVDIQFALRVALSLNNYSRQDVRLCLRKVKQSAARHNKLAGTRGYLNFLRKTLGGQQRGTGSR